MAAPAPRLSDTFGRITSCTACSGQPHWPAGYQTALGRAVGAKMSCQISAVPMLYIAARVAEKRPPDSAAETGQVDFLLIIIQVSSPVPAAPGLR